jgi:3D (Asp-Asp-Asp) domain-containing protein
MSYLVVKNSLKRLLLACILLLALYTPASDDKPLPIPVVSITPAEVSRGGDRPSVRVFEATGYCNCSLCCDSETGITASGKVTSSETVSADWDVLPEGTAINIEGIGRRVVQDKGSAIRGNRLDIWFSSHEAALEFGRKQVKVVVE